MRHTLLLLLLLTLLLAPMFLVRAGQTPSTAYAISWYTIDSGGGVSQGGNYTLQGAIGQPDAGSLQGGAYALAGGYWAAFKQWWSQYLPVILKEP